MNYLQHYIRLIRRASTHRTDLGYTEKHHVFPKSIFGQNKTIVVLTAREHYIAHALLEKIFIKRYGIDNHKTKKMIHAFFMMNITISNGQERYKNSRLFEHSKLRFIERMSGVNSPMYGKKRVFSEQHLLNLKASRKYGEDNTLYGIPRSTEAKEKMRKPKHAGHGNAVSIGRKGMEFSEEHKKNLSESHIGQVAWNKGKQWSEEQLKKLRESQKNKNKDFITDEYKKKLSDASKRVWAKRKAKKLEEQTNGTQ